MKKKLLLFILFILSVVLLLTASAGYFLCSLFTLKRLSSEPLFLSVFSVLITAVSFGMYLLLEYIASRAIGVKRSAFAFTTLFLPLLIFLFLMLLFHLKGIPSALFSGGATLSLTLMLLLLVRYLLSKKG